ncbi:MAG: acylphosphatase [Acidimicrobiales bacterium]
MVRGRVQGVWFRESCRREAVAEGVAGQVRNDEDGSVEALFEGNREAVGRLVAWCHRGPPHATVTSVEVTYEAPIGQAGFKVV